jgi:hypothetical protein
MVISISDKSITSLTDFVASIAMDSKVGLESIMLFQ